MSKLAMVFNGPPGCGKGTVIKLLSGYGLSFRILPMSGLLLKLKDSPVCGAEVREAMDSGNLVPDGITLGAFFEAWNDLEKHGSTHLMLDGVVRTELQATEIAWMIRLHGHYYQPMQIVLEVSEDECQRRLSLRQRGKDDRLEVVAKRFQVYKEKTLMAIERFASAFPGCTLRTSNDRDPSLTASEIKIELEKRFGSLLSPSELHAKRAKKMGFSD